MADALASSEEVAPATSLYAQPVDRLTVAGRQGMERDVGSAIAHQFEPGARCGQKALRTRTIRVGQDQRAGRRDETVEEAWSRVDVLARVEHVGGQDEVPGAALDERLAVLGPVDVGNLALDL